MVASITRWSSLRLPIWRFASGKTPTMPAKTSCPITLTQFLEKAEPLKVTINGQEMLAEVKQFSTGSFGWYMNAKTVVSIDGKAVSVQIGMNMAIVGSKDAER
jgi:hypothetical protein